MLAFLNLESQRMRSSLLWLGWLVLPVFVLAFHYGPGQVWLARDQAASLISKAEAQSSAATAAQEAAYKSQLNLMAARKSAFVAGIDWQAQPNHSLAQAVMTATSEQDEAYKKAADVWHDTATLYGEAAEKLLKSIGTLSSANTKLLDADRNLLESLRWAEARALVRSGEVFNGIEQLQALLDLRTAEANQAAASVMRLTSTRSVPNSGSGYSSGNPTNDGQSIDGDSKVLPIDAIREELAAAQYVGARLLREEGRPSEVWRPISNSARQHYRYLSGLHTSGTSEQSVPATDASRSDPPEVNSASQPAVEDVGREQRMQRNLEQVLNLEQTPSDQLEGVPLPRTAPLARRPGDGQPGKRPGKGPGRAPLRDGPPGNGAGIPGPWGGGW